MAPKKPQVAPPIIGNKNVSATPSKALSDATTNTNTNTTTTATSSTSTKPTTTTKPAKSGKSDALAYSNIVGDVWSSYLRSTPHNLKLIDVFLVYLMFTGAVQFLYCLLVGNYPFNAFLSGFIATVGQFVLTAGLRSQCNIENVSEFPKITPERAFGDYIFSSVVLHFAVVNFLG